MSSTETMEQHALAILEQKDLWKAPTKWIQDLGKQGGKFQAIAPKFLYYLINESQRLGGSVLDQFWYQVGTCDKKLEENIENLKVEAFVSAQRSFELLFRGLDPEIVNFEPVLVMAAAFFTHLGAAFMNPGGRKFRTNIEFSVSEVVNEEMDNLLQRLDKGPGKRKQEVLKALSFKRDGRYCLLTRREFVPFDSNGIYPALVHIIPNSVVGKQETLEYIAMFAGRTAAEDIAKNLHEAGNVMNMQLGAHTSYDKFNWGIEATEEGGEVKYLFRRIGTPIMPHVRGPGFITLRDGDQIHFGKGPKGEEINKPIPRFCNLRLAVARVLKMSAAADMILKWKDDADDVSIRRSDEVFCRSVNESQSHCPQIVHH